MPSQMGKNGSVASATTVTLGFNAVACHVRDFARQIQSLSVESGAAKERSLQKKYKEDQNSHVWTAMSIEERRSHVVANRDNSAGRGTKRKYEVSEAATVTDKVGAQSQKPHMNQRQSLDFSGSR